MAHYERSGNFKIAFTSQESETTYKTCDQKVQ